MAKSSLAAAPAAVPLFSRAHPEHVELPVDGVRLGLESAWELRALADAVVSAATGVAAPEALVVRGLALRMVQLIEVVECALNDDLPQDRRALMRRVFGHEDNWPECLRSGEPADAEVRHA